MTGPDNHGWPKLGTNKRLFTSSIVSPYNPVLPLVPRLKVLGVSSDNQGFLSPGHKLCTIVCSDYHGFLSLWYKLCTIVCSDNHRFLTHRQKLWLCTIVCSDKQGFLSLGQKLCTIVYCQCYNPPLRSPRLLHNPFTPTFPLSKALLLTTTAASASETVCLLRA